MSDRMQTGAALEQLREVASILRELSNAGPRDNSFKQWRQVTLTLLQRIWPDDQGRAARFRRIPFSPPSSRADSRTIRECYERGCCEAIAYLDSLVTELENGTSRMSRPLVRPAEAPLREMPPREQSPAAPVRQTPPEPAPQPPGTGHLSQDPAFEGPRTAVPRTPPPPPPPSPAAHTPAAQAAPPARPKPAPARAENGRTERRAKPRLKDMLGFSDEDAPPAAQRATPAPPARPAAPPAPPAPPPPLVSSVPPAPVAPAPVAPVPPPEPRRSFLTPKSDDAFIVEPIGEEPIVDEPLVEESAAEEPAWSAPVVPFPGQRTGQGRFTTYPPTSVADEPSFAADESSYDEPPDEVLDLGFDLGPEPEPVAGPAVPPPQAPPATLREMLDRAAAPSVPAPSRYAREVLAMASAVDTLGVPPQRRAIVCAALIDLGHQMETPPVQWAAIRQALAFMMDYPEIARRVIPMLLPYLDEAA